MCSAQSVLGADLALMDQTKRLHDANWQLINARHWEFVFLLQNPDNYCCNDLRPP